MSGLLPRRTPVDQPDHDPWIVGIDDSGADEVLSALSSDTARSLLSELYRDPAPVSDVADRVGTSIQNAHHHLDRLEEAGLVEVVDTWYSSRGQEMDVYAPAKGPLVLFAADDGEDVDDAVAAYEAADEKPPASTAD